MTGADLNLRPEDVYTAEELAFVADFGEAVDAVHRVVELMIEPRRAIWRELFNRAWDGYDGPPGGDGHCWQLLGEAGIVPIDRKLGRIVEMLGGQG
jgi:hypothetical protein